MSDQVTDGQRRGALQQFAIDRAQLGGAAGRLNGPIDVADQPIESRVGQLAESPGPAQQQRDGRRWQKQVRAPEKPLLLDLHVDRPLDILVVNGRQSNQQMGR